MFKPILVFAMTAALAVSSARAEFRHVVFFKFKDSATPGQVKEVETAFAELSKKSAVVTGYEWGTSESVEKKNEGFTHCFFVTFKDKAGLETYLPSPEHKAFGAKLKGVLEKAFVFDYTAKSE